MRVGLETVFYRRAICIATLALFIGRTNLRYRQQAPQPRTADFTGRTLDR